MRGADRTAARCRRRCSGRRARVAADAGVDDLAERLVVDSCGRPKPRPPPPPPGRLVEPVPGPVWAWVLPRSPARRSAVHTIAGATGGPPPGPGPPARGPGRGRDTSAGGPAATTYRPFPARARERPSRGPAGPSEDARTGHGVKRRGACGTPGWGYFRNSIVGGMDRSAPPKPMSISGIPQPYCTPSRSSCALSISLSSSF